MQALLVRAGCVTTTCPAATLVKFINGYALLHKDETFTILEATGYFGNITGDCPRKAARLPDRRR